MSPPDATRRTALGLLHALFVPYRVAEAKATLIDAEPVCSSLQALRAYDINRGSVLLSGIPDVPDGRVDWIAGDYSNTPVYRLDRDIFASKAAPLATGAWVRRGTEGLSFEQTGVGARRRSLEDKAREIVSVLDFGARGDGVTDDTAAFNAAIATGKCVSVPYSPAGYAVANIRVIDNMQIVGEKAGMALAPVLIVSSPNSAAFQYNENKSVFHCVFENLACRAAPGVNGASFYAQSSCSDYAAYFTFRQIETYADLRISYRGLFVFALWDRCRDGYLGSGTDRQHNAIVAMADAYGQSNRQNINRIKDSMFFNAFGGEATITGSYGTLWTIENSNFEALHTRALAVYDIVQVRFSNCWFEGIDAPTIVHAGIFPGTNAASTIMFDHCTFALTGSAPQVVSVDPLGTVSLRGNIFSPIALGVRLCDAGDRITINEDNIIASEARAANFFAGTHPDRYHSGRRTINGATDNKIAGMSFQNEGGLSATQGFLSRTDIKVGLVFVTIATSQTGLGGTCVVSGYNPDGGAQIRMIKDWQSGTVRDIVEPLNATGRVPTFRVVGNDLQMKVDVGSIIVFTTMLH